jgi:hypothetical protein
MTLTLSGGLKKNSKKLRKLVKLMPNKKVSLLKKSST